MSVQAPNAERQIWILTQMLRIREFETRVKRAFTDHPGVIRGHTHLADGAEASIVGSLSHFRKGDAALATYRCHGYPITLGSDPKALMAEIFGEDAGVGARSAVGHNSLPGNIAVEIECIFEVEA